MAFKADLGKTHMILKKSRISIIELTRILVRHVVRSWQFMRSKQTIFLLRAKGCSIDWSAYIHPEAVIEPSGGLITIGSNTYIDRGVIIRGMGGNITIGDNCRVYAYSYLSGGGSIEIADFVMIASHVSIYASNHVFSSTDKPMAVQGLTLKGIVINNDVWIGTGVRILDGIVVAKGCIIAAGAVLTKSTLPYTINAGVPANAINHRISLQ